MKKLWLFDIDGTLININNLHLATYRRTYLDNGIKVPDKITLSTFGMTENEMHKSVFKKIGLRFNKNLAEKIKQEHQNNVLESIKALNYIKPLKGVLEFLAYLRKNKEYAGIVTGNLRKTAALLLKKSKLSTFFRVTSCDDNRKSRKQIVKDAIAKAKIRKFDFGRVIVVGDTIHDIEAGKYAHAITIAVATGSDSLQKLRSKKPDLIIPNLNNYKTIIEAVSRLSS